MSKDTPAAVDQAAIDTARAEGRAEGVKAGAEQERTRISAILESDDAKKRPAAAKMLAFDTDKDSASAIAALAKLPEEAAVMGTAAQQFQAAVEEGAPAVKGADDSAQPTRAQRAVAMRGWDKKAN